jgi:hypothetical protein
MSNNFENLMQEVESDIRQEKFEKLWKEYGKTIVGAFVVIVGLSAAYNIWQHNQAKQTNIVSQQFSNAQTLMFSQNYTDALPAMENIANSSHKTYAVLAKFNVASILRQTSELKDLAKAESIYQEIMNNHSVNAAMRDLATVLYVGLKLDNAKNNDGFNQYLTILEPITTKESAYKFLALENKGLIQFKLKDYKAASDAFLAIVQSEKSPKDVKLRAQMMTQHIASLLAGASSEKADK